MTEQMYLDQLFKWFTKCKIFNSTTNSSYCSKDFITSIEFDKYFDYLSEPMKAKIYSNVRLHKEFLSLSFYANSYQWHFIRYCYENNLCNYKLDEAYTLWLLSL